MTYIGIDPGKKGALALLEVNGEEYRIRAVPFDVAAYLDALAGIEGPAKCALEHVGAMPGQGVTSMFSFGENFGIIQGLLTALHIPYELVRPQKWKKVFSITSDKNSSVVVCKRLFPAVTLRRSDRCRVDDDGIAEALLLAEYARRCL